MMFKLSIISLFLLFVTNTLGTTTTLMTSSSMTVSSPTMSLNPLTTSNPKTTSNSLSPTISLNSLTTSNPKTTSNSNTILNFKMASKLQITSNVMMTSKDKTPLIAAGISETATTINMMSMESGGMKMNPMGNIHFLLYIVCSLFCVHSG